MTTRLLKTNMGSYTIFNLDSATLASKLREADLSSQLNGVATLMTNAEPYAAGSARVLVGGVRQFNVQETNPALGTFTVRTLSPENRAYTAAEGPLLFRYVKA